MNLRNKIVLIVILNLVLGCAGGYGRNYVTFLDVRNYPKPDHIRIMSYSKDKFEELLLQGYKTIGEAGFIAAYDDKGVEYQAKKVGAEVVLLQIKYADTRTIALPQYHAPQTYTIKSSHHGNFNTYGDIQGFGNYSGYSTSYVTTPSYTTYHPFSIPMYHHYAVFMRKIKDSQ